MKKMKNEVYFLQMKSHRPNYGHDFIKSLLVNEGSTVGIFLLIYLLPFIVPQLSFEVPYLYFPNRRRA